MILLTCWEQSAVSRGREGGDGRARELGIRPIWPDINIRSST